MHVVKSVIRGGRDNIENMLLKSDAKDEDSIYNINTLLEKFTR